MSGHHAGTATRVTDLVALRRELHGMPEVGLELPHTQQRLLDELDGLPVSITTGTALSWIAVVIDGAAPGPTVLLRADMDALPLIEETGLDFAAHGPAMHACGHDLHMAALVGAIRILCARRDQFAGHVLAVFQPGEEGHQGAAKTIAEGVLDTTGTLPVASYALHVFSFLPAGKFGVLSGTAMAGTLNFELEILGAGGHAAHPHTARNPILAGALIVQAIQNYVVQNSRPGAPLVATVGAFSAGAAANVIPSEATLRVSLRATSAGRLRTTFTDLVALSDGIAAGHGMRAQASPGPLLPPTVNTESAAVAASEAIDELFGSERRLAITHPEMIAEDFSEFLDRTGGAFIFLGASPPDATTPVTNHSANVIFDDTVIDDAAALLAELAMRRLAS
ncbi:amidohydrolase [Microbacterium trichothecenolyticum]|uniref:Amidohydrolase n=1 Tax=Microbacterium ureisolvens TaxID=2781186 RepID=A0ABS7HYJ6_9MICO|nr:MULTISPECIES: M20 family metallopeptidase [Microbacterium]MBW9110454.1 amidohydrolase [Microbacterium ureisolvens]MBW9120559.1 amidohydrolase [Microbacterium trichothecenolyticum]